MYLNIHIHRPRHTKLIASATLIAAIGILSYTTLSAHPDLLTAVIARQQTVAPWVVLDQGEVDSGATIPANTNVVFQVPFDVSTIGREVLLGQKGKQVRYWGYCFPQNYDPNLVDTRVGFPGQMFLSEKERAVRAQLAKDNAPRYTPFDPPTKAEAEKLSERQISSIRHQLELFRAGMLCYAMSEASLAIGLDADNDGLNNKIESEIGTDPTNPDTDGDGIDDGAEYLNALDPTLRDTDSDGLIDGIEDKNWNGHIDSGETDPRTKDTDRDGLCDGVCRMRLSNGQEIFAGEDKNLNGKVDQGENDPLKVDSKGDGYNDYLRFVQCLFSGEDNC